MERHSFHTGWVFHKEGGTSLEGMTVRLPEPVPVTLPHDAAILEKRSADVPMGNCTGYYPCETVHYTKTFFLEEKSAGTVVYLEFEGVYMNASVYVNNCFAGKHLNGYTGFWLDITPYVRFGSENTIKVVVRNGVPSSRWYTGTGIYRNVRLYFADSLSILPWGVRISTPQVEEDLAVVRIETTLKNRNQAVKDATLCHTILDAAGNIVAQSRIPITMMAGEIKNSFVRLEVAFPALWNVDTPNLYTCETALECGGEAVDTCKECFGIRTLKLDTRHGLRINNISTKLRGGCIHHDLGIVGAVDMRKLEERRIRRLKEAGYNAIRCAHFPASKTLLAVCDELGMLVMNEFADAWTSPKVDFDYSAFFTECWEENVEEMVASSYNHPCVILYSIGNEIPECGNKFDVQWGKRIADKIRSLDATRYITNGVNLPLSIIDKIPALAAKEGLIPTKDGQPAEINTLMNNGMALIAKLMASRAAGEALDEAFSHLDIAGQNYAAYRYPVDAMCYPNRVMVGTETYPAALDDNWAMVKQYPQVLGDFSWTAWDYLGEAGIGGICYGEAADLMYGTYPWKNAYVGDFDLIGDRRPISYWREIIWGFRKKPYIAVQDPAHFGESQHPTRWGWTDAERCWNWCGFEGKKIMVEVYADADEIELLCSGCSLGKVPVGTEKKCIARLETVYTPGRLEAVAYRGGTEIGRDTLETASDTVHLEISFSDTSLKADGTDSACIEISLTDENGILNPGVDMPIAVSVEGPISVQGFGSADPRSEENFFDRTIRTFHGRAMLVVRSGTQAGTAAVRLHSEAGESVCVLTLLED